MPHAELTTIIPCYHQPIATVRTTLKALAHYCDTQRIVNHPIVVQNGDAKPYQDLEGVEQVFLPHKGLGLALQEGLYRTTTPWFYVLPADNAFHFTDLTGMWPKRNTYDFIVGSKLHPDSVYRIHLTRKLGTHVNSWVSRGLLPGMPIRDPGGSFFGKTQLYPPCSRKNCL